MDQKDEDGDSPLLIAVINKNYDSCDLLLDRSADVNVKDKSGNSLLHIAIRENSGFIENIPVQIAIRERSLRIIEKLVDKGADMEAKDENGDSSLLIAIRNKNYDSCDLLLDRGADVNVKDKSGNSPLHIAPLVTVGFVGPAYAIIVLREGSIRISEKLLDKGADMEAKNENGDTPLLIAVSCSNYDICHLLLDRGVDVNVKDKSSRSPLLIAAMRNDYDACDLLLVRGADVNVKDKSGNSPLHIALCKDFTGGSPLHFANGGRSARVSEKLLYRPKGAGMEAKKENCDSPVLVGVRNQNCDLLLDGGGDVNVKDKFLSSPSKIWRWTKTGFIDDNAEYSAIRERSKRIIEKMLDKGADMEAKNKNGDSPLLIAVKNKNFDLCDLLLDRGADVNVKDQYDNNPLLILIRESCGRFGKSPDDIANRERSKRIIEKMLDKGADMEAKKENGFNPLLLALAMQNEDACYLLLERGADVNVKGEFGNSPLLVAVMQDDYDMCALLLDKGADVNVKNSEGQTPLHLACCSGVFDCPKCIIELLLFWGGSMLVQDINGFNPLDKIKMAMPYNHLNILELKRLVIKLKPKELKMHLDIELECELKNLFESPRMLQSPLTAFDGEEYLTCCLKELEKMKMIKFGCHSLYHHYILCKRDDPTCVTNDELEQAIKGDILDLEFPIYAILVKVTFSKAKHRRLLLDAAEQIVNIPLPNEMVRQILAYLSNDDLRDIIESSE